MTSPDGFVAIVVVAEFDLDRAVVEEFGGSFALDPRVAFFRIRPDEMLSSPASLTSGKPSQSRQSR